MKTLSKILMFLTLIAFMNCLLSIKIAYNHLSMSLTICKGKILYLTKILWMGQLFCTTLCKQLAAMIAVTNIVIA